MPEITREQMVEAIADWRGRLIDMNHDSESKDYWDKEVYGDDSMYDAILAALEEKGGAVTEEDVFCLQAELRRINDNIQKESEPFTQERGDDLQFEYLKNWLESKGMKIIREAGVAGKEADDGKE